MILVWVCLITLLTSRHVHSKVITVNSTGGSDRDECCKEGKCECSSLSAVFPVDSNTTINITSKYVTIHGYLLMGSGDNIVMTGNGVTTIMCNYKANVQLACKNNVCNNIVIEGITWDKCGYINPSGHAPAGVIFSNVANILIRNCTFQYSQIRAIEIEVAYGSVIIDYCNFIGNGRNDEATSDIGGLRIDYFSTDFVNIDVSIKNSNFNANGYFKLSNIDFANTDHGSSLKVYDLKMTAAWNVIISKTVFSFNIQAAVSMALSSGNITLSEVTAHNNEQAFSLKFIGNQNQSNAAILSILSSQFTGNNGAVLSVDVEYNNITILISNTTVDENQTPYSAIVDLVSLSSEDLDCSFTLMDVQISNNRINDAIENSDRQGFGIFSAKLPCVVTKIDVIRVNVTSNVGGVLYIQYNAHIDMNISECVFSNNTSARGPIVYLDECFVVTPNLPLWHFSIAIGCTVFDSNSGNDNIIYVQVSGTTIPTSISVNQSNFTNNLGSCISLVEGYADLGRDILFANNTARNGAALNIDKTSSIRINDGTNIQFVNNSASSHGGAIFIQLDLGCLKNNPIILFPWAKTMELLFINNSAGYGTNAIHFSVSKYCNILVNSSDVRSVMHIPYQFNYSQIINGTLTHIPTDYSYTWLNVT